jgi:cytochrome c oxidase cbb3-type subunit II
MRNPCRSGPKHASSKRTRSFLLIGILLVISIGGLVEIAPLFYLKSTIEKVEGMRPYTPLELAGRNIYVREGCYTCHSQMIRPLRDEVERYGHYSLAAESMYDRPVPVGLEAHRARSRARRRQVFRRMARRSPERSARGRAASIMPAYPWLRTPNSTTRISPRPEGAGDARRALHGRDDRQCARRSARAGRSRSGHRRAAEALSKCDRALVRRQSRAVTEADALIAYLQMLGTQVDFKLYDNKANMR